MRRPPTSAVVIIAPAVLALGLLLGACGDGPDDEASDASDPAGTAGPADTGDTGSPTGSPPGTSDPTSGRGTTDADATGTAPTADAIDGRTFVSTAVSGRDLVDGTTVSIAFPDGRVVVDAGCNTVGAPTYGVADGRLVVGEGLSMTEMGCAPALMGQDEWLAELLLGSPEITLDGDQLVLDGGEVTITLVDRAVADPDRPIDGVRWVVDGLVEGDTVSSVPAGITASVTIADGTAMVETGCNTGSGPVVVGPDTLTFDPLATTLRGCEPDVTEIESAVLRALLGTVDYEIEGDRLSIRREDDDGTVGLELVADS